LLHFCLTPFSTNQQQHFILYASAAGVYLPEGRHPIIPLFHYSITPINCERSELSSYHWPSILNSALPNQKPLLVTESCCASSMFSEKLLNDVDKRVFFI
jgi:hypothetical protein